MKHQIELLDEQIAARPDDADLLFKRGKLHWRLGNVGAAISDYERAAKLDPESPAVTALEAAREVMDFFHRDLYNP